MSGRGKGGKGLGKGGAKRHRKVLRDNIQGAGLLGLFSPGRGAMRCLPVVDLAPPNVNLVESLPALLSKPCLVLGAKC